MVFDFIDMDNLFGTWKLMRQETLSNKFRFLRCNFPSFFIFTWCIGDFKTWVMRNNAIFRFLSIWCFNMSLTFFYWYTSFSLKNFYFSKLPFLNFRHVPLISWHILQIMRLSSSWLKKAKQSPEGVTWPQK